MKKIEVEALMKCKLCLEYTDHVNYFIQ